MTVVSVDLVVARRIEKQLARRGCLVRQRARLGMRVPAWALEPLERVGMTKVELAAVLSACPTEDRLRLAELDHEVEDLDRDIERAEEQLLASGRHSIESVAILLNCARHIAEANGLVDQSAGEPTGHRERILRMLETVSEDLPVLMSGAGKAG